MSDLLFYCIISVIFFEVILLTYREYTDKKERQLFADEKEFMTCTGAFDIMAIPILSYMMGCFVWVFFDFQSEFLSWAFITTIALCLTIVMFYYGVKWTHFTKSKIVFRRPLAGKTEEIEVADITEAGHKREYNNSHHYIVVMQNGVSKKIQLHAIQVDGFEKLEPYFVSKNIPYKNK